MISYEDFKELYESELEKVVFDSICKEELKSERLKEKYYSITCSLIEGSEKFNLTSIKEPDDIIRKHILDSAIPFTSIFSDLDRRSNSISFIDVGTGAGFPLLPVAALAEEMGLRISCTGLDSTNKKIDYVIGASAKASIQIKGISGRAEELAKGPFRGKYDIVTARAVASLPVLMEITSGFIKDGGILVALKGNVEQELTESSGAAKLLGLTLEKALTYSYTGGESRIALVYRRINKCPEIYPRRYSEIKKKPL